MFVDCFPVYQINKGKIGLQVTKQGTYLENIFCHHIFIELKKINEKERVYVLSS